MQENWEEQRNKIIGFGENSFKKSYYPDLQSKISELEAANYNLQTIFNSTSDGIIIHDEHGKIFYMNRQAQKLFNIKDEEKTNFTIYDISSKKINTASLSPLWQDVLKENPKTLEWIICQPATEKEIFVQVSISNAIWYGKQVIVAIVRDFTERIKYEQELYAAKTKAEESDRLKTVFLNNMSHEIRTPMNGIIGFSGFLSDQDTTDEQRKNYIKIIQNCCQQLLRVIDDILEISTLETKQVKTLLKEINLNDLLLDLFSIFNLRAVENRIPFYLNRGLPDNASIIYSDELKLHKILSNIIDNALKYTHDGYIEIGYKLEQKELVSYVKDTGIGVATEKKEKIFQRFSQEDDDISKNLGGLGLGLSIAKENVELLGGTISLESEKGKGSTFYITLPYNPVNKLNDNTIKKIDGPFHPESFTILVAEDEEVNFIYIETLFRNESNTDYKILRAKNGKEAIDICKVNTKIDLVLMDIKMPIVNGYEAAGEIKKINPSLPVIAQTAYSTAKDKEKALSSGCDDFISKPINKNELFKKVNNILKNS